MCGNRDSEVVVVEGLFLKETSQTRFIVDSKSTASLNRSNVHKITSLIITETKRYDVAWSRAVLQVKRFSRIVFMIVPRYLAKEPVVCI